MYALKITATTGGRLKKNYNRRILLAPHILMILSYVTDTCITSFLPVFMFCFVFVLLSTLTFIFIYFFSHSFRF